jgi:hypothetical protein
MDNLNKRETCTYCDYGTPLVNGETNDVGITIHHPNRLLAYGYNIHGFRSNGIAVNINYCPMCGRKLVI